MGAATCPLRRCGRSVPRCDSHLAPCGELGGLDAPGAEHRVKGSGQPCVPAEDRNRLDRLARQAEGGDTEDLHVTAGDCRPGVADRLDSGSGQRSSTARPGRSSPAVGTPTSHVAPMSRICGSVVCSAGSRPVRTDLDSGGRFYGVVLRAGLRRPGAPPRDRGRTSGCVWLASGTGGEKAARSSACLRYGCGSWSREGGRDA